jgi:hypothetical protein
LLLLGIVYGNLVHIVPVLVCCTKKNLATLLVCMLFKSKAGFLRQAKTVTF